VRRESGQCHLPEPAPDAFKTPGCPSMIDAQNARELIACVIAVESNFDSPAVSRKGARGLMQLPPDTASRLAVRDVFDPQENINVGTRYVAASDEKLHGHIS